MRVLLADDHRGFLEVVRNLLVTKAHILGCVHNGESLVEAAMELHPDVIVTDISMPKLNGIDAAYQLRESGSLSKIIFLTVHADPDFVQAALKTGAVAYIWKLRIETDLLVAIEEVLAGRIFVSSLESAV